MTKKSDQQTKTKLFKNDNDDTKLCITRQCLAQGFTLIRSK